MYQNGLFICYLSLEGPVYQNGPGPSFPEEVPSSQPNNATNGSDRNSPVSIEEDPDRQEVTEVKEQRSPSPEVKEQRSPSPEVEERSEVVEQVPVVVEQKQVSLMLLFSV